VTGQKQSVLAKFGGQGHDQQKGRKWYWKDDLGKKKAFSTKKWDFSQGKVPLLEYGSP
jgi:hypothetical protein